MKHRIKNFVSLIIAASMLLSLIPLTSAALDDEFAGLETLEEVPFEFELEPGDLPWEQLGTATLAASDIPACISPALAEARCHVNRLYLQEPDDYTVMFQNRDGSKTIYVFSYPVKSTGMSMNTSAAIQVNGSAISFASGNIITSRIGVDLFDYNIGYCEVQTFFGGMLTADGVNITEDARGWARSESAAENLVYNMSGSAAAEYNMNMSSTANATLVPGITITPIEPTPSGGITVMTITYSELAGLMSFKNVQTNQYLSLTTSATSLTTSSTIVNPYSSWYVQYDSEIGYYLSNLSDVYNTYLSFSGTNVLFLNSEPDVESGFTLSLISQSDETVTIDCYEKAINSNGTIYVASGLNYDFPTSCQWKIVNKRNAVLATRVSAVSSTRIEQSGVGFYLDYTVLPANASMFEVALYYADTNTEVTHDTETSDGDEYEYYINTPGIYTVYYKDSVTGVCSENFTLIIFDIPNFTINNSLAEATYSIRPLANSSVFVSMNVSAAGGTSLVIGEYYASQQKHNGYFNTYEDWEYLSRAFTINATSITDSKFKISAILTEFQYTNVPEQNTIDYTNYSGNEYLLINREEKPNTLNIASTNVGLTASSISGTDLTIMNVGDYYLIFSTTSDSNNILNNKALKYVASSNTIVAADYVPSDLGFRWTIEQIGINAPLIRQTQKYICGSATFLQVLYGAGIGNLVPESNTEPNKGLHSQMYYLSYSAENGETQSILPYSEWYSSTLKHDIGGTNQETFATRINQYSLFDNYATGQYGRYVIRDDDDVEQSNASVTEVKSKIEYSLSKGWAPFVLTRSGGRPYKYADGDAHYICIIGFNEFINSDGLLESYVIVSNCHWLGTVLGVYAIPLDEFYNKVSELFYYY